MNCAARSPKIHHMSDNRQRFDDQRYVHFITFSVYRRRRLLDLNQPQRICANSRWEYRFRGPNEGGPPARRERECERLLLAQVASNLIL